MLYLQLLQLRTFQKGCAVDAAAAQTVATVSVHSNR